MVGSGHRSNPNPPDDVNVRGPGESSKTTLWKGVLPHYDKRTSDNGDAAAHERNYSSLITTGLSPPTC